MSITDIVLKEFDDELNVYSEYIKKIDEPQKKYFGSSFFDFCFWGVS